MIPFDLERALAGDKVLTRSGKPVTEITEFNLKGNAFNVYGVVKGELCCWGKQGSLCSGDEYDLFMAPKPLSGFVNIYRDGSTSYAHTTKKDADNVAKLNRTACIDLSQHNEGEGL
jgi:hypothetical protein